MTVDWVTKEQVPNFDHMVIRTAGLIRLFNLRDILDKILTCLSGRGFLEPNTSLLLTTISAFVHTSCLLTMSAALNIRNILLHSEP